MKDIEKLPSRKLRVFTRSLLVLNSLIIFALSYNDSGAYMFWNQAGTFTGLSSSYIAVANSSSLNIIGSFTIEAWLRQSSPTASAKGIVSKGGSLGTSLRFALRLTNGRLSIITNGAQRLITRSSTFLQAGTWYHVSGAYDSSNGLFVIYINGIADTTATITGQDPQSNTDSLYVGISGNSSPFNGNLDEVRVWNRVLTSAEVGQYWRSTIAASTGIYSGLVLSLPFQNIHSAQPFSGKDFSGDGNSTTLRNVTSLNLSYSPSTTINTNEAIALDGNEDYLAAKDTSTIEPTTATTLDLWLYPRATQTCNLITKGNQYALKLVNNQVRVVLNGINLNTPITVTNNSWNRITVTGDRFGSVFYHNGNFAGLDATDVGTITDASDSLYIGGFPGATGDFNGLIDEVRIQKRFINSADTVFSLTYKSLDLEIDVTPNTEVCYNLDGTLRDNQSNGGPELKFRNNARFSHPATIAGTEVSPLMRSFDISMQDGFYLNNQQNLRLPSTGTSGNLATSITVNLNEIITSLEVFVALNHSDVSEISIDLIAPNGDSARLMTNITPASLDNSARLIFVNGATSQLTSNSHVSLSGIVAPQNNFAGVFSGDNAKGQWIFKFKDNSSGDTGVVHTCGLRFNGMMMRESNFSLSNFLEGHYNNGNNTQIGDTLTVVVRNFSNPAIIYDTEKLFSNHVGSARFSFANIPFDARCWIQVLHRNSIETWSNSFVQFQKFSAFKNFHLASSSAFGNNQVQVNNSPVTFAFYSGDVNQDRTIDATDVSLIDNDATNFVSGYVVTDLTGDDFVDGTDFAIADNNAANFISAELP